MPWPRDWFICLTTLGLLLSWPLPAARGDGPEDASCRVNIPGAAGSGVAIAADIVATNCHVVDWRHRSDATVTLHADGKTYRAETVALDPAADVALLRVSGVRLVPVAMADAAEGAEVHLLGYGRRGVLARGVGRILRAMWGRRTPRGQVPVTLCHVASEPGDSGGGIFNLQGQLVALNWGAISSTGQSLSTPARYVAQLHAEYLRQIGADETQCGPGGCSPASGMTAGGGYGPPPPKFPVQRPSAPPPQQLAPPLVPVPQQPAPAPAPQPIDTDKLVAAIVERMAADARFRGPQGAQGPPGVGTFAVDIDSIVARVVAQVGRCECPPPSTAAPTAPRVHYVLVGDERLANWSRVEAAYRTATSSFRGIRLEAPPSGYVGQLPALVRYTDSIPAYVARGSYEVEQALGRMARGQAL